MNGISTHVLLGAGERGSTWVMHATSSLLTYSLSSLHYQLFQVHNLSPKWQFVWCSDSAAMERQYAFVWTLSAEKIKASYQYTVPYQFSSVYFQLIRKYILTCNNESTAWENLPPTVMPWRTAFAQMMVLATLMGMTFGFHYNGSQLGKCKGGRITSFRQSAAYTSLNKSCNALWEPLSLH